MFDIILNDDPVALACLCAILLTIGSNMVYQPSVRWWGKRVAGMAYVIFCLYAYCSVRPTSAGELAHIAFRGLFSGGLCLAGAWAALSAGSLAFNFIRSVVPPPKRTMPDPIPQIVYVEKPAPQPAAAPKPTVEEVFDTALATHSRIVGLVERVPVGLDTKAAMLDEEEGELVNDVRAIIKGTR